MSNKRAVVRLLQGCEKVSFLSSFFSFLFSLFFFLSSLISHFFFFFLQTKKVLSANPQAPLHVSCIMEDIDVSLMIKREVKKKRFFYLFFIFGGRKEGEGEREEKAIKI